MILPSAEGSTSTFNPSKIRLNKYLSEAGVASRRGVDRMIAEGRVSVNGEVVLALGLKVDVDKDRIQVDGRPVRREESHVYIMLNKPPGYIVTRKDPFGRPTVMSLLPPFKTRVNPVGRLDADSQGLLLLTSDGELANRLLHPRFEVSKTYLVKVKGCLTLAHIERLEKGVYLDGKKTAPAKIKVVKAGPKKTLLRMDIHEGRKREIRRMIEAVGCRVLELERIRLAGLSLGGLKPGRWRHLSQKEAAELKKIVHLEQSGSRRNWS